METKNVSGSNLEIIKPIGHDRPPLKAVLFDFDGTISTLRQGWEEVMGPFMVEFICGNTKPASDIIEEVYKYINESTGIQTIYQMEWLVEAVKRYGLNPNILDKWSYKDEYNRRLMDRVKIRVDKLKKGELKSADFMIKGASEFLQVLYQKGIDIYVASGTDHTDVVNEAGALGLCDYFTKIAGAPKRRADCSKEAVLKELIVEKGLKGEELLVVGDGKVEISLGAHMGAITLGAATDEIKRFGVNSVKRDRLIKAGAHAITGDFVNYRDILGWIGL